MNVTTLRAYSFGFYEDGTEAGSTAIAAEATNINRDVATPQFLLRYGAAVTLVDGAATDDYQLQVSRNGGAFQNVTTTSTIVKSFDSSSLTDGGATTNRLTDPVGSTFIAGKISEDGLVDNLQILLSRNSELLFTAELVPADLVNGDILAYRVLYNGAVFATYTVTPQVTVIAAVVDDRFPIVGGGYYP